MVLPIESADTFFERSLKIPEKYKRFLIPAADYCYSQDREGAILDQRIKTRYFTAWVHNIWIEQNAMLYPFSVKDTWALHYWLARKIPAALEHGNMVMVDDCTLFYLTAAEYTAWPIIGNAMSFHINFTQEAISEYVGSSLSGKEGIRFNPKGESRLINPVPFTLNPVTYRIIKRVLNCTYRGIIAEIYQSRNFRNLLDIYLHQLTNETGYYHLLSPVKQVMFYIREHAQKHPEVFTSYERVAERFKLQAHTLRTGFESYFHTPLHVYVMQEKLNTAFHLLAGTSKTYAEISGLVGYARPKILDIEFEQYFGYPMEFIRGKTKEKRGY